MTLIDRMVFDKARKPFLFLVPVLFVLFLAASGSAQQVEMSSSLNPVGSGARATGMGGAFIGVADDATAASWNPAGLVQLEKPEVSIVHSSFQRGQKYGSTSHPEINGSNTMDTSGINYASAVYPFVALGRNMVVSLNYQRLYELDKKVKMNYTWDAGATGGVELSDVIDFRQKGYLYAFSPAMAVQVRPSLYAGVTLNIWKDYLGNNGWENTYRSTGSGTFGGFDVSHQLEIKQHVEFWGVNANLGVMWSPTEAFTLGAVFKTPFTANLKKDSNFYEQWNFGTGTPTESTSYDSQNLTMKMPASYGMGLQYRHSDRLTLAFDLYQTQWSVFSIKDQNNNQWNPITSQSLDNGRLHDTTQARFGTEYLFIGNNHTIALRGGLFYDPEPGTSKVDDYYGFSLGTGYSTPRFSVDASYQYRFGKKVDGDISYIETNVVDIKQHTVMVSGIYYF